MICALGVVEIYSATLGTKFAGVHLKQIYWILGGIALMFIVSLFNYQALLERVPLLYVISIASLLAVDGCWAKFTWARGAGCRLARFTSSRRSGSSWS